MVRLHEPEPWEDASDDYDMKRDQFIPFKGRRVRVYVVDELDVDRENVLTFETEAFFVDTVSGPKYDVYSDYGKILSFNDMPTYQVRIGGLLPMDSNGTIFRYENFMEEDNGESD